MWINEANYKEPQSRKVHLVEYNQSRGASNGCLSVCMCGFFIEEFPAKICKRVSSSSKNVCRACLAEWYL